jgi:outer membrane protein TolC
LASSTERNALVAMSRESAILDQQKLQISFEVSGALAEVERVLRALQTSDARLKVARKSLENLTTEFNVSVVAPIEAVLEARRTIVQLQAAYDLSRVDYSIALASLSVAQGTLLNEAAIYCSPIAATGE